MTSLPTLARADLAAALDGIGVPVHTVMPPVLHAPCVLLLEADPFITHDDAHGALVTFELIALAAPSPDETRLLSGLDTLVGILVERLWHEWRPEVSSYQTFTFATGEPHLGARLTLTSTGWTIERTPR